MSQRERWIIYPLLFLCFALAIRDQWPLSKTNSPDYNVVQCKSLLITDEQGAPAVFIGTRPEASHRGCGEIKVFAQGPGNHGAAPAPAVKIGVSDTYDGIVETKGMLGEPQIVLTRSPAGIGDVAVYDKYGNRVQDDDVNAQGAADSNGGVTLDEARQDDPRSAKPRPPMP